MLHAHKTNSLNKDNIHANNAQKDVLNAQELQLVSLVLPDASLPQDNV